MITLHPQRLVLVSLFLFLVVFYYRFLHGIMVSVSTARLVAPARTAHQVAIQLFVTFECYLRSFHVNTTAVHLSPGVPVWVHVVLEEVVVLTVEVAHGRKEWHVRAKMTLAFDIIIAAEHLAPMTHPFPGFVAVFGETPGPRVALTQSDPGERSAVITASNFQLGSIDSLVLGCNLQRAGPLLVQEVGFLRSGLERLSGK